MPYVPEPRHEADKPSPDTVDRCFCEDLLVSHGRHPPPRSRPVKARRWGAVLAIVAAGGLLTACGGASSGSGQSITLYSGQHEQTTDSLVAGFEKATGITVNVRNDDEAVLADEIVTKGARSPADVIYTENSPVLEYLGGKGLLAKVDASTLSHTPSRY